MGDCRNEALALHRLVAVDFGRVLTLIVAGAWTDHIIVDMVNSVILGNNHLSTRK